MESANTTLIVPWYRRSSPYWIYPIAFIYAISLGATVSARVEIINILICRSVREAVNGDNSWFSVLDNVDLPNCRQDPMVQSRQAELNLVFMLTAGILSTFTTGFWSRYGDRHGRRKIIAVTIFGLMGSEMAFILIILAYPLLSYKYLVLGNVVSGLCGGLSLLSSSLSAYVSDSTSTGSRSNSFSIYGGCMFGGLAVGPLIGNNLIFGQTDSVLAAFYFALITQVTLAIVVLFVIPESLSKESQKKAKKRYNAEKRRRILANKDKSTRVIMFEAIKETLRPITAIKPFPSKVNGLKVGTWRERWSVPLLSVCFAFLMIEQNSITIEFLYAQDVFDWGPIELGNLTTIGTGSRMIVLLVLLPFSLKLIRWLGGHGSLDTRATTTTARTRPSEQEGDNDDNDNNIEESLLAEGLGDSIPNAEVPIATDLRSRRQIHFDAKLDLALARFSLVVTILVYLLLALPPRSPAKLLGAICLKSFGGGLSAALHSLCLLVSKRMRERISLLENTSSDEDEDDELIVHEQDNDQAQTQENNENNNENENDDQETLNGSSIYDGDGFLRPGKKEVLDESGNLFGGMAMLATLLGDIVGPFLFNGVWAYSVPRHMEETIWVVVGLLCCISFLLLLAVSVRSVK